MLAADLQSVADGAAGLTAQVDVLPTPKDSVRHRQAVQERGGKLQFPLLIGRFMSCSTVKLHAARAHCRRKTCYLRVLM